MGETNIRVSGNILSELSEKIPTDLVALNELIKNAYDAMAKELKINFDKNKKLLIIEDNGDGMDLEGINALFHISKSNKIYGERINDRYIQGAKGLGFLAVFRFGNKVLWETKMKKGKGYSFEIDFDDLKKSDDISEYPIKLNDFEEEFKGTRITILLKDIAIKGLTELFATKQSYEKIQYAFNDEKMNIELFIDGKRLEGNKKSKKEIIGDYFPKNKVFDIKYNSKDGKLQFFIGEKLYKEIEIKIMDFQYEINLNLRSFYFGGRKSSLDIGLYTRDDNKLTPLVYINHNLFNNYTCFDVDILRSKKSGATMPQMIGDVNIISDSQEMEFNSDRTNFVQNSLTDNLKQDLKKLNIEIQRFGAKYRKEIADFNYLICSEITDVELKKIHLEYQELIKEDFYFKNVVECQREREYIIFKLFGTEKKIEIVRENKVKKIQKKEKDKGGTKKETKKKIVPANIVLSRQYDKKELDGQQILLRKYILSANNNYGEKINVDDIKIKVDNKENELGILPSITNERTVNICFYYQDSKTEYIEKNLKIDFIFPKSKVRVSKNTHKNIFRLPIKEDYEINISVTTNKLIEELNSLDQSGNVKNYNAVIACCLRNIFELSLFYFNLKAEGFEQLKVDINRKRKEEQIKLIIECLKQRRNITAIDNHTKAGFHVLMDVFREEEYSKAFIASNLGAHRSMDNLTEKEIEEIAHKAMWFVVAVNEMINNDEVHE